MRTPSQSTINGRINRVQYKTPTISEQNKGVYYGTVLQTDQSLGLGSNSPIPAGQMTVSIPTLNPTGVYGPMPYPGKAAPPVGTRVAVSFNVNNNPVALTLYGSPTGATGTVTLASLGTHTGSLTFVDGIITAFVAPA